LSFAQDNIFADGHEYQLAPLEENSNTGEYHSILEVSVQGNGTTGIGHIERETFKVFELEQNFPNPYQTKTLIPFRLKQASHVKLELWDLNGRKVSTLLNERKESGDYQIEVNPSKLNIPNGNYVYQLEAVNSNGVFRLPKMMTQQK
jgi:hypothetical protein